MNEMVKIEDLNICEQQEINGGVWGIVVLAGFYLLDEYWVDIKHTVNDMLE